MYTIKMDNVTLVAAYGLWSTDYSVQTYTILYLLTCSVTNLGLRCTLLLIHLAGEQHWWP